MKLCRISLLLIALLLLGAAGCATTDSSDSHTVDRKPWNSPAGWEQGMLGVPY